VSTGETLLPSSLSARRPHVALLIESSRGYGRGLLRGISEYIRLSGHWSVYLERHHLYDAPPPWLKDWEGDGIIARVENHRLLLAIRARGVPIVDLRGRILDPELPVILTDDAAGARLAAEHLLERGLRHFAFCGFVGTPYSDGRQVVFHEVIRAAGYDCALYDPPRALRGRNPDEYERRGLVHEEDIARWLRDLPQPLGVMACNDARGQQVLNACRELGIAVPDQCAVIGVDNDDVVCDLCDPPLTSVVPSTQRIGYEAAELLDRMMAGQPAPREPIIIPPQGIVTRRSTDVLAIDNREVAAAVRYIREHACESIGVEDVLARVRLSQSALERQFREVLGRTPKAEIIRVQLERVKQLLVETPLTLKEIAGRSGFSYVEYMCAVFKRRVGETAGQYRSRQRQAQTVRPPTGR
jgi:LacI family transcriptional regulator